MYTSNCLDSVVVKTALTKTKSETRAYWVLNKTKTLSDQRLSTKTKTMSGWDKSSQCRIHWNTYQGIVIKSTQSNFCFWPISGRYVFQKWISCGLGWSWSPRPRQDWAKMVRDQDNSWYNYSVLTGNIPLILFWPLLILPCKWLLWQGKFTFFSSVWGYFTVTKADTQWLFLNNKVHIQIALLPPSDMVMS